jgi:hypothetical protein
MQEHQLDLERQLTPSGAGGELLELPSRIPLRVGIPVLFVWHLRLLRFQRFNAPEARPVTWRRYN